MGSIVALDVGDVRVGVARADTIALIASPLATLERGDQFWQQLESILTTESAELIVIGLPRNLSGDDTDQTRKVRSFIDDLGDRVNVPLVLQDEALTSKKAEDMLRRSKKAYSKADIDAHAAAYILDDYLTTKDAA